MGSLGCVCLRRERLGAMADGFRFRADQGRRASYTISMRRPGTADARGVSGRGNNSRARRGPTCRSRADGSTRVSARKAARSISPWSAGPTPSAHAQEGS